MSAPLLACFKNIPDPRSSRNQKHPFTSLIAISLLSALCGIDSFNGMADFAELRHEELAAYLPLPSGAPSHDTFQRLWEAIDAEAFAASFQLFTNTLATLHEGIIAIDGKTIRNSRNQGNALHLVTAWCETNQLVLAQQKVDSHSNEITAIPELLALLSLENRIVTIDAIGCQRHIAGHILAKSGDYLLALKGNQAGLFEDVKIFFEDEGSRTGCVSWEESDKGHGRLERRTAWVTAHIEWLQARHDWPGLRSIGVVHSEVWKQGRKSEESRYYVTSLPADAERICRSARSHWGIENKLHWRLDVVFNEDKACITNHNAAENMSLLRKWALNIAQHSKTKPDQSIRRVQQRALISFKELIRIVSLHFHA